MKSWTPLVLEDVKADTAELVDVWVVNLGPEKNLGWHHGVLIWQEELTIKDAAFIRGLSWSSDLYEEVSVVLLVWFSIDSNDRILGESLSFLLQKMSLFIELTLRIRGGMAILYINN